MWSFKCSRKCLNTVIKWKQYYSLMWLTFQYQSVFLYKTSHRCNRKTNPQIQETKSICSNTSHVGKKWAYCPVEFSWFLTAFVFRQVLWILLPAVLGRWHTVFALSMEVLHLLHRDRINIMPSISDFKELWVSLSPMCIWVTIIDITC